MYRHGASWNWKVLSVIWDDDGGDAMVVLLIMGRFAAAVGERGCLDKGSRQSYRLGSMLWPPPLVEMSPMAENRRTLTCQT